MQDCIFSLYWRCSAWLYATTGVQALGTVSELTPAQPAKKIIAAARAASGGAACALGRAAKVENEQGDGECDRCECRHAPCP